MSSSSTDSSPDSSPSHLKWKFRDIQWSTIMSDVPLLGGRYNVVRHLGRGGFGIVEACTDTLNDNAYVAVKTIPARFVNRESKRLLREVDIMIQLANKHPHLMSVLDVFVTPAADVGDDELRDSLSISLAGTSVTPESDFNVHMVMPMMRGDLHAFTRQLQSHSAQRMPVDASFMATVSVVFAFQIAFGLDYLHQCGIVHRDLKSDNVLIRLDFTNPYASTAVIADFGLARDASATDTFYICTRHYRPPEVVTNTSKGDSSIDIWSFGCIMFEICTGKTLFCLPSALNAQGQWEGGKASQQLEVILNIVGLPAKEEIIEHVPTGNVQSYLMKSQPRPSRIETLIRSNWRLDGAPQEEVELWIDLIKRCLNFFATLRPTAKELCCHPLFQRYDVHYGTNVSQYPVAKYEPIQVSESSGAHGMRENKELALMAVMQLHKKIEEESDNTASATGDEVDNATSRARAAHCFPTIQNPMLRGKYSSLPVRTAEEIEVAKSEILNDLTVFTHDAATSAELRLLLNYFMGMNTGVALDADDVVVGAAPPLVCDDEDDDEW